MKLQQIDKARYRKHFNVVIVAFIASFMVLAVLLGQLFISLFSSPEADNFWFNFSGVGVAFIIVLSLVNHFKNHIFMSEVLYVWELKKQINYIHRKLAKVKKIAFDQQDVNALIILSFYYQACSQLYHLDDNTITVSSLNIEKQKLEELINKYNLTINVDLYEQALIQAI
ncbi:DUF3087 family protein [Thalassomonas sp. M1454]|uniref:DUF3087 family protein n=1 Tax=Thalassomonas sp. M1454 TaxID=2594477 RepID=UPI00117F129A|nr:DUF3087 family protein [Thalassomonas sp. M1454]TRX56782.1 DUF3087 domain-containing protein [Thalassomonas sp. M1454]